MPDRRLPILVVATAVVVTLVAGSVSKVASQGKPVLDYEQFKSRVEPIFLERREGHVRCYVCHSENNNAFHLERLAPGSDFWSEEQSRKNFGRVSGLRGTAPPVSQPLVRAPLGGATL